VPSLTGLAFVSAFAQRLRAGPIGGFDLAAAGPFSLPKGIKVPALSLQKAQGQGRGTRSMRVHFLLHPKGIMTNEGNPARVQVIHSEAGAQPEKLNRWLEQLVSRNGSDLLLVAEAPASIRMEGQLLTIGSEPLTGDEIEAAVLPALAMHARNDYQRNRIGDSSYRVEGLGRFRINLHRERGRTAATVRALPSKVPALSDLHLPAGVAALAKLQRGLVIVGGATGSGKTTTLAGLVNEINQRDARHIVTIEDPIEYEHAHARSVIEQVEIGIDAPDFPTALRAAR